MLNDRFIADMVLAIDRVIKHLLPVVCNHPTSLSGCYQKRKEEKKEHEADELRMNMMQNVQKQ